MSADNGIYVLESPTEKGSEYRVAHCFAIESMDYFEEGTKEAEAVEVCYFGKSAVYLDPHEVMKKAIKLHNDVEFTEYGIRCFPIRTHPFPNMTWEDANAILNAA